MKGGQAYSAQRQNPLLYWTTLIYMIGLPNFLHFDSTGREHLQSVVNLTTVSNLLLIMGAAYVMGLLLLLERKPLLPRKVPFVAGLWFPLLGLLTLATVLMPKFHLTPASKLALPASLFGLFCWILAFYLLLALYSRTPAEHATDLIVELIGRLSWSWVVMVWLILPIMPAQAYSDGGESAAAKAQLGGQLLGPSLLSTLAITAFFYSLFFFPRGLLRVAGCGLAFLTIVLTHTRIEQASFLLLLLLYAVVYSGKFALRLAVGVFGTAVLALGIVFRGTLLAYISRGQSAQSLATLDDRTRVWDASLQAARLRPFLGYGYGYGVKGAIRDHWIYVHWIPPHSHNEYITALLSGGILAAVLVLCIYGRALWSGFHAASRDKRHLLFFLVTVLMTFRSLGGSNIIGPWGRVGALFLLAFVGIVGAAKTTRARGRVQEPEWAKSREMREAAA